MYLLQCLRILQTVLFAESRCPEHQGVVPQRALLEGEGSIQDGRHDLEERGIEPAGGSGLKGRGEVNHKALHFVLDGSQVLLVGKLGAGRGENDSLY